MLRDSFPRASAIFFLVALFLVGPSLLPGHTAAPLDVLSDFDAWKSDPTVRVRVSNSMLSDVAVQFIPWDTEVRRLLGEGQMPWSNIYAGEGGALWANPQTGLFSPFTWPRLLLGLPGWSIALLLKLLAAMLSMWWLAAEMRLSNFARIISSIVFATSGFCTVTLLHPHSNVIVLAPAFLASALRYCREESGRSFSLVVLFAALCTAGGHPELLFISVVAAALFVLLTQREAGAARLSRLALAAALGFLLLAVQLVPFMLLLRDSDARVTRQQMSHPFRRWAVVATMIPGVLGSPIRGELDLTGAASMSENFVERSLASVGLLTLLTLLFTFRRWPKILRAGLVIGSIALVLSWYPPGLWFLLRHIPPLGMVAWEYFAFAFVLFGSLSAGAAVELFASERRPRVGVMLLVIGGAVAVGASIAILPPMQPSLRAATRHGVELLQKRGFLHQTAAVYEARLDYYLSALGTTLLHRAVAPAMCWAVAGWALLLRSQHRVKLFAVACVVETIAFAFGFIPSVEVKELPHAPPVVAAVRSLDPGGAWLTAANFEVFPANAGTLCQLREVVSYDVLTSAARTNALRQAGYDPFWHSIPKELTATQVDALRKLGVRWIFSRSDVPGTRRVAGPTRPAVGVYEVAGAPQMPMPIDRAPNGFRIGLAISLAALVGTVVLGVRMSRLTR